MSATVADLLLEQGGQRGAPGFGYPATDQRGHAARLVVEWVAGLRQRLLPDVDQKRVLNFSCRIR